MSRHVLNKTHGRVLMIPMMIPMGFLSKPKTDLLCHVLWQTNFFSDMSEYWKSQPKHFCKFCSCWIADNKPSRDYHEKGKKHQQNVQAKISEIHKKSREDAKKKVEMSSYLKEMEKKALAAVKRDIQGDPSLAALYGVKVKEKDPPKECGPVNREQFEPEPVEQKTAENVSAETTDYSGPEYWDEDKSPEGYTYYWNTVTGESRWVPPEGYVPKAERLEKETADANENVEEMQEHPEETEERTEETQETEKVETSNEELDETRGVKRKLEEVSEETTAQITASIDDVSSIPLPGGISEPPAEPTQELEQGTEIESQPNRPKHSAYSKWEIAKEPEPEPQVDLQLPSTNVVEEKMLTVHSDPKIKFREKTVSSLSRDSLPAVFKKKKKGIGYKNLKARTDDL